MSEELKIQVSAFIDGELPAAEAELLTRRLGRDAGLRRQAAKYLHIGQLMRGERNVPGISSLVARIAAKLNDDAQPATHESVESTSAGWLRPAAGVAIAASVALLALTGLRQLDLLDPADAVPTGATQLSADNGAYTEPLAIDVMADRPGEMLTQYYLSHGETSGELGANGILSRLVTLELRGGELVDVVAADDEGLEASAPEDDNEMSESGRDQ